MIRRPLAGLLIVLTLACILPIRSAADDSTGMWTPWRSWKMPDLTPSLPRLPKAKTPAVVRSTQRSFHRGVHRAWTGTKRGASSAWETTKWLLRPYDPPEDEDASTATRQADRDTSFWGNLFGGSKKNTKAATVNDFLRQPTPY